MGSYYKIDEAKKVLPGDEALKNANKRRAGWVKKIQIIQLRIQK